MKLNYDYTSLKTASLDSRPYGNPLFRGVMLHKESEVFVLALNGYSVAEVHPGNTVYLILGKTLLPSVKRVWQQLLAVHNIDVKKRRRVKGDDSHVVTLCELSRVGMTDKWKYVPVAQFEAAQRVKIDTSTRPYTFTNADPVVEYQKDNDKYRAFIAKCKMVKATLNAQIKMGLYDDDNVSMRRDPTEFMRDLIYEYKRFCERYFTHSTCWDLATHMVHEFARTKDTSLLPKLIIIAAYCHESEVSTDPKLVRVDLSRRVNSLLKVVQHEYLRSECLTIGVSNNPLIPTKDSDDQDSQLLPTAGLRDVQVPREAEVC
jgi:hypothetical protein